MITLLETLQANLLDNSATDLTQEDLRLIQLELDTCINHISSSRTFRSAEPWLFELGKLQDLLSIAWFKHDIEILPLQKILVRRFERHDDRDTRKYVFKSIRTDEFFKE